MPDLRRKKPLPLVSDLVSDFLQSWRIISTGSGPFSDRYWSEDVSSKVY